jgi:hypothetical protein
MKAATATTMVCFTPPKHETVVCVAGPDGSIWKCHYVYLVNVATAGWTRLPGWFTTCDVLLIVARKHGLEIGQVQLVNAVGQVQDVYTLMDDGLDKLWIEDLDRNVPVLRRNYPVLRYVLVPDVKVAVTLLNGETVRDVFPGNIPMRDMIHYVCCKNGVCPQTAELIPHPCNDDTLSQNVHSEQRLHDFVSHEGTASFTCIAATPVTLALHWAHECVPDDDVVPHEVELGQNPIHLLDSVKNAVYDRLRGKAGQFHICNLSMVGVHVTSVTQTGCPPDQVNCDLVELALGGTTWADIFPWITCNCVFHVSMYFYDLIEHSLDTNLPNTRVDGVVYIYRSDSFLGVSNSQPYTTNHDTDTNDDYDGEFGNEDEEVLHLVEFRGGVLLKRNEFVTWTWVWKKS